jgi:hypothetical protein
VNPDARDISSIVRKEDPRGLTVQAFGRCRPADCDWGTASARLYARSISGDLIRSRELLQIILHVIEGGGPHYEVPDHFKDGPRRSDYTVSGNLGRTGER